MPAAAVIPAPLAYTIIVAVKRLVVGLNANLKIVEKKRKTLLFSFLLCTSLLFFSSSWKKVTSIAKEKISEVFFFFFSSRFEITHVASDMYVSHTYISFELFQKKEREREKKKKQRKESRVSVAFVLQLLAVFFFYVRALSFHELFVLTQILPSIRFCFQHCEQIRVYQTCLWLCIECLIMECCFS